MTKRNRSQRKVERLRENVEGFELAWGDVNAAILWLRCEIREMDHRRAAWFRDVWERARFEVQCGTQLMIRDAWDRADQIIARVDSHIVDIVAGRSVVELTENAAF